MLESVSFWALFREIPTILRKPVHFGLWSSPARKRDRVRRKAIARRSKNATAGSRTVAGVLVLEGEVSKGYGKPYAIGGHEFAVHEDAWIIGNLEIGCFARVKVPTDGDEELEVSNITVIQPARSS